MTSEISYQDVARTALARIAAAGYTPEELQTIADGLNAALAARGIEWTETTGFLPVAQEVAQEVVGTTDDAAITRLADAFAAWLDYLKARATQAEEAAKLIH